MAACLVQRPELFRSAFSFPIFVLVDRLELRHDRLALPLEKWCQHHLLAECGLVLIHREPWPIRGDLEQNTVWLAEVQAAEPVSVHLPAVRDSECVQTLRPGI